MSSHYRPGTSRPHGTPDTFRRQMAATDYAYARGEALLSLRRERRLTREHAAHEIGTTTKSLFTWEKRNGPIKRENAKRLAEYYGVELDAIISQTPDQWGAALIRIERKIDALMLASGIELAEDDEDGPSS